ncbi:MAG TPA: hypothetical protein VGO52_27140 [Hyphomonadaceae bacterium]|jgi:hypothetical protein|nr:hypothetical protein [Hyphomonadaceae bacterium]
MTDTSPQVIQRGGVDALRAQAKAAKRSPGSAGKAAYWTALIVGAALTILPIIRFAGQELETFSLLQASDSVVKAELARGGAPGANTAYLEVLAELGSQPATRNDEAALSLAERATSADPGRASAWAQLAWQEYLKAKSISPASLDALRKSIAACPVCEQDLIRWRFNFVLANWDSVPEDVRKAAFEQADILRWVGQNREFLGDMRLKAIKAGIPFDAYRTAVNTPVRSFDLNLAPEAEASSLLRPRL